MDEMGKPRSQYEADGQRRNLYGYLAARRIGIQYVDRHILREAARPLEIDVGVLESMDQRTSGLVENLIRAFAFGAPETPGTPAPRWSSRSGA